MIGFGGRGLEYLVLNLHHSMHTGSHIIYRESKIFEGGLSQFKGRNCRYKLLQSKSKLQSQYSIQYSNRKTPFAILHSQYSIRNTPIAILQSILQSQSNFPLKTKSLQAKHGESSIPLRRLLGFNLQARQLLSIELSSMCVIKENNRHFSEDLKWISALVSSKRIVYNLKNLVHVIAKPLVALGASTPTDLLEANNTHNYW